MRTNAVLGQRLAGAMDIAWLPNEFTDRNRVKLAGLNMLLEGAYDAYHRGSLAQLQPEVPETLPGSGWRSFVPAISKIEAVTRIAALTRSPPEWLGPGSKEHKSVLVNLADRLLPNADLDRTSKTRLARDIVHELGAIWTDDCYSTGETISLKGLNTVLAAAERRLGRLGATTSEVLSTPEDEGAALAAALNDGWRADPWDGRRSVEWMREAQVRGFNENEWQGWYFEARGREILNEAFSPISEPPRSRYGNTVFDYRLNHVWDLKAHTEELWFSETQRLDQGRGDMILNDAVAIRQCVDEQGLGFLVLGGRAVMDEDGAFVAWHREFKASQGKRAAASNSGLSRMRKRAFVPLHVEAYWIPNTPALDAAIVAGQLAVRTQGRQAPRFEGETGAARAAKFHMDVRRARAGLCVARCMWPRLAHSPASG